jgi:hypothetical protein
VSDLHLLACLTSEYFLINKTPKEGAPMFISTAQLCLLVLFFEGAMDPELSPALSGLNVGRIH